MPTGIYIRTKEHCLKIKQSRKYADCVYWLGKKREKSANWKGGISAEPYCQEWLSKDYKESIKERDGFNCMNPSCSGKSNRLCIHHIDCFIPEHIACVQEKESDQKSQDSYTYYIIYILLLIFFLHFT